MVADFNHIFGAGDPGFVIAQNRADPHALRQLHVLQRHPDRRRLLLDHELLHFQLPAGEVLEHHGTGRANAAGQLHRREVLEAEQPVDAEVPLVIERAEIVKHAAVHPRHGAAGAHRFGHAGRDEVDFIDAGHRQADVDRGDAGLKQHARLAGRTDQRLDIDLGVDPTDVFGIAVDHRHAVPLPAQQVGDPGSDRAGAQNEDSHDAPPTSPGDCLLFSESSGICRSLSTRPCTIVCSTIRGTSSTWTPPYHTAWG